MVENALVVESNLTSRHQIAKDLQSHGIVREVVEADSVQGALTELQTRPYGACVIGPLLNIKTARHFVAQGRLTSVSPHVAFIRLIASTEADSATVFDDRVQIPYEPQALRSTIERAVEKLLTASPSDAVPAQDSSLAEALQSLAIEIRGISRALTSGQLKLTRTGEPSTATLYALRKTLERAFGERNQEGDLPTDVKNFVNLSLDWLHAKVRGSDRDTLARIANQVGGTFSARPRH